jgi:hypothetical protein
MTQGCASRADIGKPLDLAAGRETDARARGYAEGAPTANTCKDGLLGNMYRAKYTTTGTYAGNTNVRIDLMTDGLTASPMTRREDETWKIIGAFVIAFALRFDHGVVTMIAAYRSH